MELSSRLPAKTFPTLMVFKSPSPCPSAGMRVWLGASQQTKRGDPIFWRHLKPGYPCFLPAPGVRCLQNWMENQL